MMHGSANFALRVVQWQQKHGRKELPWQCTRDPYRVWLSEIMLQQTQVGTVREYYGRFLARFPDHATLAEAELDEVLALWSGLGYYSRARNLHRCAQEVRDRFGGEFPRTAASLQTLPGIGRSTAAAIASFCFGERVAILDGNVKRVLSRVLGFDADLSIASSERALWALAEGLLPLEKLDQNMPRYTQGLMDIGATVCLSRNPLCDACPLEDRCVARLERKPEAYPVKSRKLKRSAESLWLLWAKNHEGFIWLERRPTPGVWAGLFCLPVFPSRQALADVVPFQHHGALTSMPATVHALTHKDLHLHPVRVSVASDLLAGGDGGAWFSPSEWPALGMPAPVRKLLTLSGD
jgi:A/G-specific adenine glycosylase